MSKPKEKVFIAWGGNQNLAQAVGIELGKHGFLGIIGGGSPSDMFVGTQIFSQINQCTRAIILAENVSHNSDTSFSNNLMFEWGYLTAKMESRKPHVFLIGVSRKNLPSDLSGIWAKEIDGISKTTESIAQEIVCSFIEEVSRPVEINKIEIFDRWNEIKRYLEIHSVSPAYSEIECAHYLLHSIEVCYAYMEEEQLQELIDRIKPSSDVLAFAIKIIKANLELFTKSHALTHQISLDTFSELKAVFDCKFDFINQDRNLHMWFEYFCASRLGMLYTFIILQSDFDAESKLAYSKKAVKCFEDALYALNEIVKKYPGETVYVKLYEGYVYRNLHRIHQIIGDTEKAFQCITDSSKAHEIFYLHYKQHYPSNGYIIKQFGKEYYFGCAERLKYIEDPIEKKITENTIRSFFGKLENESGRQHVVLEQLRHILAGKDPWDLSKE